MIRPSPNKTTTKASGGSPSRSQEKLAQARPRTSGPTIVDVAEAASVSTLTVSRFLNHPNIVANATREKIEQAMAAIGYVPNQVARSLASNRSRLVACIVPTLVSSIFEQTIRGLADQLRVSGYSLLIGSTDYDEAREIELVPTFARK